MRILPGSRQALVFSVKIVRKEGEEGGKKI
jgi:hypothetical protein